MPAWAAVPPRCRKPATSSPRIVIERRIGEIARRQLGLITSRQLRFAGLADRTIRSRAASERLHRIHPGIYAVHPPPFSPAQLLNAAVLGLGTDAVASDLSAAHHTGLTDSFPRCHHVTVPPSGGRAPRKGVQIHRRAIDPRDRIRFDGVWCTAPHRTLVDLAASEAEHSLEMIMLAAQSDGLLNRGRLGELAAERRGRPGIPKLERLLALEPEITRSELERLFRPVWQLAGVPRPRINRLVAVPEGPRSLEVDLTWPEIRLAVELDSQRFHGDWEAAERDRERDQLLALAGWVCHRFVRRRVAEDPVGTAGRLRQLCGLRVDSLRGRGDQAA